MFALKQILVPVDFSEHSWLAIEDAATLAQHAAAEVDLLHVWEPPALVGPQAVFIGAALPPETMKTIGDQALREVEQVASAARTRGFAIRHARAVPGSPYQVIVDEAARGAYDLIVVGTHGRSSLARVLLGSVAERVVRYAPCPVLVARAQPAAVARTGVATSM